ncbi:MAG: PH domain-containing protein [Acidobacteria bacterium]|nr:MAG: PH domain-containing protein [Acidobacteriota bacterium]REK07298.1 MAG: PH domain-containing protein [Acidobacteriota bacterium]
MIDAESTARVLALSRPHPNLLKLYVLQSLLLGPFFPFALIPYLFRYSTLRYVFDEEGVSMRWGVFFRREISLNYARIQDIHLSNHLIERWLGLARVQIQTASGSAAAEMTIEGLQEFELVRDFLYSRMRGAKGLADLDEAPGTPAGSAPQASDSGVDVGDGGDAERLAVALENVARELAEVRRLLESEAAGPAMGGSER